MGCNKVDKNWASPGTDSNLQLATVYLCCVTVKSLQRGGLRRSVSSQEVCFLAVKIQQEESDARALMLLMNMLFFMCLDMQCLCMSESLWVFSGVRHPLDPTSNATTLVLYCLTSVQIFQSVTNHWFEVAAAKLIHV